MKKALITIGIILLVAAAGVFYYLFFLKRLPDQIAIPYISHQKPKVDPHVMSSVPIADKLDEVLFDGLFNVSATASGITYEDGLGEFMGIDKNNVVTVRLKPKKAWHNSFQIKMEPRKMFEPTVDKVRIDVSARQMVLFAAKDLQFTLRRVQKLGSLSPDYILVSQAVADFSFTGPDENDEIRFQFRPDRIWIENDIKEVLSFKVLPASSEMDAPSYDIGTGPYMKAGEFEDAIYFYKNPLSTAQISKTVLKPFIDNSTFISELRYRNINALLSTPFGGLSPILDDSTDYFFKSNISTCFFALLYNVKRLNRDQRAALKSLVDNEKVLRRFFKIGTEQQRHIANYKGAGDNYVDYLNFSVFPGTSYYIEEEIVAPVKERPAANLSVLPDTVRVKTCLNYDFREELSELVEIFNDPSLFNGKIKVSAVDNAEISRGDYDAVLVPVSGYRSNFLFDLYAIFLREPDFSAYKINLVTGVDAKSGKPVIDGRSFEESRNFFRLDLSRESAESEDVRALLNDVWSFMSTHEIGDKQAYARFLDELESRMALGSWLFSLPSLAYFSTQFDANSIDLYGTASQLSTIEKWQEKKE